MIEEAARASGLALTPRIVDACAVHYDLMIAWNRTHNLTRITAPEEAARKHYLDCLVPLLAWELHAKLAGAADIGEAKSPAPAGGPASFVDVGAGAGFPGLFAALVWPDARAVLAEKAKKRQSFLQLAAARMGVAVSVVDTAEPGVAECALSRATLPPGERAPLFAAGTRAVAVWGHPADESAWRAEVAGFGEAWRARIQRYNIEGLNRALLIAERG